MDARIVLAVLAVAYFITIIWMVRLTRNHGQPKSAASLGSYFEPPRRIVGLLMLELTCVFGFFWVYSYIELDGSLGAFVYRHPDLVNDSLNGSVWVAESSDGWITFVNYRIFSVGRDHNPTTGLKVPYWSIVITLTLLSAWLLFSRPRAPKPTASGHGISN